MSRSRIPVLIALVALALATVPAALAKGGDAVRLKGVCTQHSTAKLKLSREDSGIEVEFEVDQNRNGVPWKVTLLRDGMRVASSTLRTHGPSGSFEVHRVVAGTLGSDRITAVATRASGERCTAHS